jgi:hypothetical protein
MRSLATVPRNTGQDPLRGEPAEATVTRTKLSRWKSHIEYPRNLRTT